MFDRKGKGRDEDVSEISATTFFDVLISSARCDRRMAGSEAPAEHNFKRLFKIKNSDNATFTSGEKLDAKTGIVIDK